MGKLANLEPLVEPSTVEEPPKQLPEQLNDFSAVLSSIGFMNIDEKVFKQLLSMYPSGSFDSLRNTESQLANLFKCDVYHHGCYFTADNEAAFLDHVANQHPDQSLYCFYCTKAGHAENCNEQSSDHGTFNQANQLVSICWLFALPNTNSYTS